MSVLRPIEDILKEEILPQPPTVQPQSGLRMENTLEAHLKYVAKSSFLTGSE